MQLGRPTWWATKVLLLLLCGTGGATQTEGTWIYQWSISGSDMSPNISTAPPFLGERNVYLWLECGEVPADAARMDITGSLEVTVFSPMPGVTNAGTLSSLDLSFSTCIWAIAPILVGTLTVSDPTGAGGRMCLGGANLTRECPSIGNMEYPHFYRGFSTDGTPACYVGGCPVDYALPDTWGHVKALYAR
jgi:hypothetical protein